MYLKDEITFLELEEKDTFLLISFSFALKRVT